MSPHGSVGAEIQDDEHLYELLLTQPAMPAQLGLRGAGRSEER